MPSPHHNHHHHNQCTHCCCCSCSCSCSSSSPSSPPPLTTSDQLLQLLASHLLIQQQSRPLRHPNPHKDQQQLPDTQTLLHSLHRRVAALESSLPHLSPSRPPASRSPPPPKPRPFPPVSLRDLAARTIQARFRRFLVRRSQTLRHLKRLAAIKSDAAALRSSLSGRTRPDSKALSQRAMDLLLELDSIQSGDPMIREGRRSISRELVRILEFVDKVLAKEQQLSLTAMDIAAHGEEDDRVPLQATKQAKSVIFAENREESRVPAGAYEPFPEEAVDGVIYNDRTGLAQRLSRELEGTGFAGEEDHLGLGDDGIAEAWFRNGLGGQFYSQSGNPGLSAPLPVQMEHRRREFKKNVVIPSP